MKLRENRGGGHGHVTSYTLSVGSAEARHLGFVDETGERVELEKSSMKKTTSSSSASSSPRNTPDPQPPHHGAAFLLVGRDSSS